MAIDITARDDRQPLSLLFVVAAIVIGYLLWNRPHTDEQKRLETPDAVVLIDAEGMGNSTLLDAWAADNGYELRRYQSNADLTLVEDWAKMLVETGKKESPCVVLAKDGRVEIMPITDNLLNALERQW